MAWPERRASPGLCRRLAFFGGVQKRGRFQKRSSIQRGNFGVLGLSALSQENDLIFARGRENVFLALFGAAARTAIERHLSRFRSLEVRR